MKSHVKKYRVFIVFSVVLLVFVLFSTVTGISTCLLYNVAGFPCPACGLTRAWLSALTGQFSLALHYHPLFWSAPLVLLPFLKVTDKVKIRYGLLFLALFIVVWVYRMAVYFPGAPPMNFNEGSLVARILAARS